MLSLKNSFKIIRIKRKTIDKKVCSNLKNIRDLMKINKNNFYKMLNKKLNKLNWYYNSYF